jgi:hypothetical protein
MVQGGVSRVGRKSPYRGHVPRRALLERVDGQRHPFVQVLVLDGLLSNQFLMHHPGRADTFNARRRDGAQKVGATALRAG